MVIDYVLGNEESREKVNKMKVEERVDSDHQPITVWIEGRGWKKERRKKGRQLKRGCRLRMERERLRSVLGRRERMEKRWKRDGKG